MTTGGVSETSGGRERKKAANRASSLGSRCCGGKGLGKRMHS